MLVNVTKTEGLRCGRLKGQPYSGPGSAGIAWCKPGEYIVSLGIPFAEERGAVDGFIRSKYTKMKCLLANWHAIHTLTPVGRAMIAGSLIFSRFRYLAQSVLIPKDINNAIHEDVQALIWNKDLSFDAEEMGTERSSRRWMKDGAQYKPKRELGLGVLHWNAHVKALQSKAVLQYLDASGGEYKAVLDRWMARLSTGRGAIASSVPVRTLFRSATPGRTCRLPPFWKAAVKAFRELKLVPITPNSFQSRDEAKAEPFWCSWRFKVRNSNFKMQWINSLELRRLQDLYHPDGSPWVTRELEEYYEERMQTEGRAVLTAGRRVVTFDTLNAQWRSFSRDVPEGLLNQLRGAIQTTAGVYSSAAQRIMQRWGWYGGPLRAEGIEEPVIATGSGDGRRRGLGYKRKGLTLADRRARIKAITYEDDGESVTKYAVVKGSEARVVELSPRGRPAPTGEVLELEDDDVVRDVVWWGEGISGIAELTYPHPSGWTVVGADDSPPLDKLTVKVLTAVYRRAAEKVPTCRSAWEKRLGAPLPWREVGALFQGGLLTPKDYSSYFKNILHRAMLVRSRMPAPDGSKCCRCCHGPEEHFVHLADCAVLRTECWDRVASLAGLPFSRKLALLGATSQSGVLPRGLASLWILAWKFVIIEMTQVGLHGGEVDARAAWRQAVRRLVVRVHAKVHCFRVSLISAEGKGGKLPAPSALNALLEPLAEVSTRGSLTWTPLFRGILEEAEVELKEMREVVAQPQPVAHRQEFTPQASEDAEPTCTGAPPLVADHARYAWPVTRTFLVRKEGTSAVLYTRLTPSSPKRVQRVEPGTMLPTEDNGHTDQSEAAYTALKAATGSLSVYHIRYQLLIFDATEDREVAERYLEGLHKEMAEHLILFTEVRRPCSKAEAMCALEKAFSRPRAPTVDCIGAKGPTELHRRAVEQDRSARPIRVPTAEEQAQHEHVDPYDEEAEILRELEPQGPEPDDYY